MGVIEKSQSNLFVTQVFLNKPGVHKSTFKSEKDSCKLTIGGLMATKKIFYECGFCKRLYDEEGQASECETHHSSFMY